jgi:hypothetical protein
VSQFLKHPTLRYRWVRYVPVERVADEFWGRLQTLILKVLSTSKLFFVRGSAQLRVPSELLLVTDRFRDEDNKPLLPDTVLAKTAYVSAHYHREKDISVIKRMGLEEMSFADFLVRLQLDLSRSDARMRSEPPESQWHTKVAKLLIKAIEQQPYRRLIELLPIIPLTNGAWVTPKNASLFFPTSGGVDIPTDLPLSLVNATSLLNQSRTSLFTRLGVTECEPSRIFPLIEQRSRAVDVTMQQSTSHVVFVFWHHSKLPTTVIKLRLAPKHGNLWFHPSDASAGWTYCSRYADRYSMSNLLSGTMPDELKGKINFLHPFYYDALEKCERRNNQSGLKWFRDFAQLKHTPQLQARDSALKKSPELDYVITLRPESLLGVLKANWNQYQSSVLWNEAIQSTEVPILCSDELMSLNDTFLPMPRLKTIVARLGLQKGFGFLEELDGLADNTASTWMFLEHFNVGWDTNIDFWLIALRHAYYDQDEIANEVVFEIYSHLQRFTQADEIDAMK